MTTRRITAEAVELVKRHEGFRAEPYFCPAGVRTVGYGHVLLPGESFGPMSEAHASDLLRADLARYGTYVLNRIKVPLTDNQFSALASLCFNAGTAPLTGTLGTKLNEGLYSETANEFERWIFAKGRRLPGLAARRAAEKALFLKEG